MAPNWPQIRVSCFVFLTSRGRIFFSRFACWVLSLFCCISSCSERNFLGLFLKFSPFGAFFCSLSYSIGVVSWHLYSSLESSLTAVWLRLRSIVFCFTVANAFSWSIFTYPAVVLDFLWPIYFATVCTSTPCSCTSWVIVVVRKSWVCISVLIVFQKKFEKLFFI